MASARASDHAFLAASALFFVVCAVVTVAWCASMDAMGGTWVRMPGQTWPAAAASFLGAWVVMMGAMMLPPLVPMLRGYRRAVSESAVARLGRLTAIVGLGYFVVWALFGAVVFPTGLALAEMEMRHPGLARAVPIAAGAVVLLAGLFQLSPWKARHLASCRNSPRTLPGDGATAWRHGLHLGLHCCACCVGLMAVLLVVGVMDLGAMALVAAAIAAERLGPSGGRVPHAVGVVVAGGGVVLIVRALSP